MVEKGKETVVAKVNELGECRECITRKKDHSEKELHKCSYCEISFCIEHFEPKPVFIRDFSLYSKYPEIWTAIQEEIKIKGKHPCFQFTDHWFEEKDKELKLQRKLLMDWLDKSKAYRHRFPRKKLKYPPYKPKRKKRKNWANIGLLLAILFFAIGIGFLGQNFPLNIDLSRYINRKREPIVYFETLDSLIVFLESDDLNRVAYKSNYTCVEFANDFIQRARNRGYNCFSRYDLVGRELDAFNDAVPKGYIVFVIPDVGHTVVRTRIDDMDIIVDPQTDIVMLMQQRKIQWWWFLTKTATDFTVLYEGEITQS